MIIDIVKQTLMITSFVLVMMLLIEYVTVQTKGNWSRTLQKSSWLQIVTAAVLGIIPGCLGAYTAVTLYTHKQISFAALVTAMIATSGDEAFLMFSAIPGTAVKITIIIFAISIFSGFLINLFSKNKSLMRLAENHLEFHESEPDCNCYEPKLIIPQLRNISFQRTILLTGILLFIFGLLIGELGHSHPFVQEHGHEGHNEWDWIRITFLAGSLFALFIFITVPDHFLNNHLWDHIIKKHLLKLFLWIFGTLLFIHFALDYLNLEDWLKTNLLLVMLIAVIIGIIPESGPHFIFITLFASGSIPFSILLANSVVQDGHGALPLLAESKRSFIAMKLINLILGLFVGFSGYFIGF